MQVPLKRTPDTQAIPLEQPFARAAPETDISPITKPIEGFGDTIAKAKNDLEEFDLNSRVLQEANDLNADFDKRKDAAPLGAPDFTKQTMQDYTARHNQIVNEYQQQGYSRKSLENFSLRLGALRQHFGEQALQFESHSTLVAANSQVDNLTTNASQYVQNNPLTGYTSSLAEVRHNIDLLPGVDADTKEELYQRSRDTIRKGGLEAMARMHPQQVITALDPKGLTAPADANLTGGAYDVVNGAINPPAHPAAVGGFDAAVEHVLGHEGGYNASDMNGKPVNFGINQGANPDLNVKDLTRDQAKQIYHDRYWVPSGAENLPANMQAPYFDVYIRNPKFAKRALAESNGDPTEFMRLSSAYFGKLADTPAGAKYKKAWANRDADNLAIATGAAPVSATAPTPVAQPATVSAPDQSVAPPTPANDAASQEIVVTGQRPADIYSAKTGIPILDDANGAERVQALMQAREEGRRKSTALKSSLDVVVANATAAITLPGGYKGPMPPKDTFIAAYGPVEGEQKYAAFADSLHTNQVMQTIQTLSPAAIQAQVNSLKPDPNSPTLAEDMQRYKAATEAQSHILEMRKNDPAAYVLQAYPDIAHQLQNATTSDQRRSAYTAMENAFDQLQIPENERTYLTTDARKQMAQEYKTASPQQKLGLIETWLNEMGGRQGRLLHGAVDTNQDVALYRTLSARGGNFRTTFEQALEGQDIIKKDPARKPSPGAMTAAFTSMPGRIAMINDLSPEVSHMYNETAAALYVYKGGRTDPTTHQISNPSLYEQSLREAMGGNPTDPKTGFANFGHGSAPDHTILPPGVNSDEFEHWRDSLVGSQPGHVGDLTRLSVRGLPPTDNQGHLMTLHDIQDQGVFVMVAPGTYGIKMSSDGKMVGDRTGQPFLLKLDRRRMGLR